METATTLFPHVNERDWDSAAALVDTGFARAFQEQRSGPMSWMEPIRAPSVEELLASDPSMPRAAAEYQVRRRREMDSVWAFAPALRRPQTDAELARLTPLQFVASQFAWEDRRSECARWGRATPDSLYSWEALGAVAAGPAAYVVYREHRPQPPTPGVLVPWYELTGVLRLTRTSVGWRVTDLSWFPGIPAGCVAP